MMRTSNGEPITSGTIPVNMCQPPVNAMTLVDRLSPDEARRVLHCVAIWVPEAFEKGLQRVSEEREIEAAWHRERTAGGAK